MKRNLKNGLILALLAIILNTPDILMAKNEDSCKNQIAIVNRADLDDTIDDFNKALKQTFKLELATYKKFQILKNTLNVANLKELINKFHCLQDWVNRNKSINKKYSEDIDQFIVISDFIGIILKNAQTVTSVEFKALAADLKETIENKLKKLIAINSYAVHAVDKSTDNSRAWKNKVPKLSVFEKKNELGKNGKYTQFFKSFLESKQSSSEFFDKELSLINQRVINQETSLFNLKTTIDTIDQIIYRLKLSHSFDIFNLKQQLALSKFYQEFLTALINQFGNGLYYTSNSLADKLAVSKDFAPTTIIYISSFLFTILNKLYDEIVTLTETKPNVPIIADLLIKK